MRRARDYFAQSVRADPQDTYSLYQYACFLKRCDDQVKAVDYLLRAVEAGAQSRRNLCVCVDVHVCWCVG
jgi:Tfp pilus assembly protein PilF